MTELIVEQISVPTYFTLVNRLQVTWSKVKNVLKGHLLTMKAWEKALRNQARTHLDITLPVLAPNKISHCVTFIQKLGIRTVLFEAIIYLMVSAE